MSISEKFQIGQTAQDHIIVTEKLIYETADFSGDYNPVHTSEDFEIGRASCREKV